MTIFARNPDTGVAAWAYQMTPHDAWDYDGINEMVLTDSVVGGATVPTLTHFDRNGFAYLLDRRNGKLLKREQVRSERELGEGDRPEDRPARSSTRPR